MLRSRLEALLARMRQQHLLVVGDGCLDMYWRADMQRSVLSRETPHFPLPVVEEQYSLGAGSNVAQNLAALGCTVTMVTVVGQDWRGQVWMECAQREGIETGGVIVDPTRWTPAYGKPIRMGIDGHMQEDARLDFINRTPLSPATEAEVIRHLESWSGRVDAIIVADQVSHGVITDRVREALGQVGVTHPTYVDSRDWGIRYRHAVVKPNTLEFAQALGLAAESVLQADESQLYQWAKPWIARVDGAICLTRSNRGAVWMDSEGVESRAAVPVPGPIDPVGAGDSFLAAMAASRTAGATNGEAMECGMLAASVVLRKIGITGAAEGHELLAAIVEGPTAVPRMS